MTTATNSDAVYDELLVLRWQSGEAAAMSELVDRWHTRLFRHVRRLTDSIDDAAEVMQEVWLAMIRNVLRLDDPQKFPAWAYRIASNKAADFVRKKSRHKTASLDEPEKIIAKMPAKIPAAESGDLTALLEKLSVEHRTVVSLRYGEEMPLEEIAETLGVPLGTVKSRLHYALEYLRNQNNVEVSHGKRNENQ
jgi:RNA polymerase sigma-70 factor (ECF subfamily)